MTASTTVWAVRIGTKEDVEGTLSLEESALVFRLKDEDGALDIALKDVRKVRRLRGSPVILIDCEEGGKPARFAFFFAKPPPLVPEGRESKRRAKRKAVSYLQTASTSKLDRIRDWEKAIKAAAGELRA